MILKLANIIKNIWKKLKLMLNKDLREARIDSKYLATEFLINHYLFADNACSELQV